MYLFVCVYVYVYIPAAVWFDSMFYVLYDFPVLLLFPRSMSLVPRCSILTRFDSIRFDIDIDIECIK